jgi:hypothetical protein
LPADRPPTVEDLARATGITALASASTFEQGMARLLAPVAEALASAHAAGIVHRDVKPSNILIRRDGRAVLADFGLAKGDDDPALSLTGEGIGTPYYMSPEQAYLTGKNVDHRTDVYSFGVTLYEALSGRRPFGGASFLEVVESIRSTLPPALRQVRSVCTRDAEAVVRKAMARLPDDRYVSAAAMTADLQALADGRATTARQEQGGPLRRARSQLRLVLRGETVEYRSMRELLGLPLVHIAAGRRPPGTPRRHAKGWLAVGDVATGVLAFGSRAYGGVAFGGIAFGAFSWGGIGAGIVTWSGIAGGVIALGGLSLGWLSVGGLAVGHTAIGGIAYGQFAVGGLPYGTHVLANGIADPAAKEHFATIFGSWSGFWSLFGL